MFIDLKQHIITLAAVFLALGVGIVVGGSFMNGRSIENYVSKGLEQEFGKLREENVAKQDTIESLQEQVKRQNEFANAIAPSLVRNRLVNHRVGIIQTGDYSEATQNVKMAVEEAGGSVASMTTLTDLNSPSAELRAARAVELVTGEVGTADPINRILSIVANSIAYTPNPTALETLERKGLLSTSGDYSRRVFYIVLVGGSTEPDNAVHALGSDLALIDKLMANGAIAIVGVEPTYAESSFIPAYHGKDIPTVDNVDQAMGQVALVYAIGGETGNFGVKKSADRVVPRALENYKWRFRFP